MDLKKQIDNLKESEGNIDKLLDDMTEMDIPVDQYKQIAKVLFKVQKDLRGGAGTIEAVEKRVKSAQQNLGQIIS
jgi:hypothetical protein